MSDRERLLEAMARAMFESRHGGLKNCWAWDDAGLDDEHPWAREKCIADATAALAAIPAALGLDAEAMIVGSDAVQLEAGRCYTEKWEEALTVVARLLRALAPEPLDPSGSLTG